jgi:lysyl-tRNA synthetase, class I
MTDAIHTAAQTSKAWPFEEARKIAKRFPGGKRDSAGNLVPVLFETGYGPSGCRTSARFSEVARTTMVRHALRPHRGSRSDAADLLLRRHGRDAQSARTTCRTRRCSGASRQAADPHAQSVQRRAAELSASQQRDAAALPRHVRLRLRVHVRDRSLCRRRVRRKALLAMLAAYDEVMDIMLPTLREERRRPMRPSSRSIRGPAW